MISFLSLVYLVYGLLAVQSQNLTSKNAGSSIFSPKSVMCTFRGNMDASSPDIPKLDPKNIPCECEVLIYTRFSIDMTSSFDVDCVLLQQIVSSNKPVIIEIHRATGYFDWIDLLNPGEQYPETTLLREFAIAHNIKGFLLTEINPTNPFQTFSTKVGQNLPSYIKQLKGDSNLIIGLSVSPYAPFLKSVCTYNFEELNAIVDYYEVSTIGMNFCRPDQYNGRVPIKKTEHGPDYYMGMEEVTEILTTTKIDMNKIVYVVEMFPINNSVEEFSSYHQVCANKFDCSMWCIQNTNDFFLKGSYAREQNAGCAVVYFEFDDILNTCGCGPFIGLKNIAAGLHGGQCIPCAKFDVQQSSIV